MMCLSTDAATMLKKGLGKMPGVGMGKSRLVKCGVKICEITGKRRGDFCEVLQNKLLMRTVNKIDSC